MQQKRNRFQTGIRELFTASPFLILSLIGFVVFSVLPILISLFLSLTDWNGIDSLVSSTFLSEHFIGFQNYIKILTSGEFFRILSHNLYFIVLYIPAMLVASLSVAWLLNKNYRGSGFLRVVSYIPVLTSWIAASLIWKWVLSPKFGVMNNLLGLIGIHGPAWLQSELWAMPAVALVSVWKDMGFFGLILLSGLQGIDKTYYEAASIDGANGWQQFLKITIPLLSPSIFFVLVISLINSFQIFPQIMIMTDGGPNGATQVMVERIYKYGFRYYEMGYASAFSWLLFLIIFWLTNLQMKLQKNWVHYGA